MALDSKQIAELLKLRALGWSQAEIAEKLNTSQQVIGYQLKKLKEQSKKKGTDEGSIHHWGAGVIVNWDCGITRIVKQLKEIKVIR